MDKDTTLITAPPAERRMKIFWRTFGKVPKAFLFSKALKKMPEEGLNWAPRSFMGLQPAREWFGSQDLRAPREEDPNAVPTNAGLELALPGFALHRDFVERVGKFESTQKVVLDDEGIWYVIRLEEPWRQGSSVIQASQFLAIVIAHESEAQVRPPSRQLFDNFSIQDNSDGILISTNNMMETMSLIVQHASTYPLNFWVNIIRATCLSQINALKKRTCSTQHYRNRPTRR